MKKLRTIAKALVLAQIATPSIKNSPLTVGEGVETGDVVDGQSYKRGTIDVTPQNVLSQHNGRHLTISIAELSKMRTPEGSSLLDLSGDEVAIPARFTVKAASDRLDRDGKVMFPANQYKGYQAYINKADRTIEDYNALILTGLIAPEKAVSIKDYVVVID